MTTRLIPSGFPRITAVNSSITSPNVPRYNCIAWAAEDMTRWWWPVQASNAAYWPNGVSRQESVDSFVEAFATLGYSVCEDGGLDPLFEKVALYIDESGTPTHMARQLTDGNWTSKMGKWHDISHSTPDAIEGPAYGTVHLYMRRSIPKSTG